MLSQAQLITAIHASHAHSELDQTKLEINVFQFQDQHAHALNTTHLTVTNALPAQLRRLLMEITKSVWTSNVTPILLWITHKTAQDASHALTHWCQMRPELNVSDHDQCATVLRNSLMTDMAARNAQEVTLLLMITADVLLLTVPLTKSLELIYGAHTARHAHKDGWPTQLEKSA